MKLKKLVVLFFLVLSLTLIGVFSGITSAGDTKENIQSTADVSGLDVLANMGKIPPVRQEFKNYVTDAESIGENFGLMPPLHADPVTQPLVRNTDLPEAWDWRDHNGVSPVGNQGSTGSCWVWGALKGFEANVLVATGDYYDLSERNIFNCNPWNSHRPASQRGGLAIMVANWLSTMGAVTEACDPWGYPWNECLYDECFPPLLGSYGWTRIPYDVETIKWYLYNYGPIQTSMYASFPGFGSYNGTYVLYWTGSQDSNHSIQIVGWDDTMHYPQNPPYIGYGAWICQNSWGTAWGDDGYFYIAYAPGYNANVGENPGFYKSHMFWPFPQMVGKLYYYDETGPSTWCGDPSSPDPTIYYGAVIFEATNWETIRYLETWVPDGNTVVESWIYRTFNTGSPNGPQRMIRHQNPITFETGGFKRLRLARSLYVRPGDSFVTVIRVDCDTYDYPLAVEYCWNGPGCTYETGVCWESQNGDAGSWYDCSTWQYDLSLRARAFRLTYMPVKLDPDTEVVKIGEEYKILWEYPPPHAELAAEAVKYVKIEVVESTDIDQVVGKIADKVPLKEGAYHWIVDESHFPHLSENVAYCIRITDSVNAASLTAASNLYGLIGVSNPFKVKR